MKGDITWSNLFTRAAIIIGTVAVIIWAIPSERRSYLRIDEGKPWRYSDLTAPFDFPIYKSDKTIKKERDSLMRQHYRQPAEACLQKRHNELGRL